MKKNDAIRQAATDWLYAHEAETLNAIVAAYMSSDPLTEPEPAVEAVVVKATPPQTPVNPPEHRYKPGTAGNPNPPIPWVDSVAGAAWVRRSQRLRNEQP